MAKKKGVVLDKFFILASIVSVLTACSSGVENGEQNSGQPIIGLIYSDIIHYHPSFDEKRGDVSENSIGFTIAAQVTDPQGLEDLLAVQVVHPSRSRYWSLLDVDDGIGFDLCYYEADGIFECTLWLSSQPDSIWLTGWELYAYDDQGNEVSKPFDLRLPGGDYPIDERLVISDLFTGSGSGYVEALEAMTISTNLMVFESDFETQSFRIEFFTNDHRADNYKLVFYGQGPDYPEIGSASGLSPSIVSTPIINGQPTELDMPWSEVVMRSGYDASDIRGLHIKLLDEPISWEIGEPGRFWHNYVSYSEFIELE